MVEKMGSMGSTGNQNSELQHQAPVFSCLLRIIRQTAQAERWGAVSDPAPLDRARPAVIFLMYTDADWGALKKGLGDWA